MSGERSYGRSTPEPPHTEVAALAAKPARENARPSVATLAASRFRQRLVAAGLTLGSLLTATALLWSPGPERDDHTYASFAAVRGSAWAGMLFDVAGSVVAGVSVGLAVCILVRSRGAIAAALGAAGTAVGASLFAAGVYAYFVLAWYATEPRAISAASGAQLMRYLDDNPVHIAALQFPGLLLFSIGVVLLATALWRSGAVWRWIPVALAVLAAAQFLTPDNALDFVQAAMFIPFLAIAWFLWQKEAPAGA